MSNRNNLYFILGAFGVIIAGNYLLFYDSGSYKNELLLASSLTLMGVLYFFVLASQQRSLEKVSALSRRIRDNEYFQEKESPGGKDDAELLASFTDHLISYIQYSSSFVKDIKEGNLTSSGTVGSKGYGGPLMQSLTELRAQLVALKEEEKERHWVADGITRFVEILRKSNKSAEEFYDSIITGLVKYLEANQGILYVCSENEEGRKVLKQVSCYAYNRKKYLEKEVEIGQGLVGQVYLEKQTTFLKEIPKDYVRITSGLGEATPRNLLLVPFKLNDQVECIIELASFHDFKAYQIEFLEKVGESIASTISSFKINESTKRLLEESQHQAEIMQAQEEELRQNMEELEATQENLERESMEKAQVQGEVIKTRDFLQKVMNAIPDPIYVKDANHKIVVINDAYCALYDVRKEEVMGKNEYEVLVNDAAVSHRREDDQLFNEKAEITKEDKIMAGGKEVYIISKKRVIEDEDGKVFLVGINHNITHMKEVEQELAKEKYLMDALMTNATDYIYFKDQDSKFIRMSNHMLQLFNAKSLDDVVGKSDFDFFTAEHAQPAFDAEQKIISTGVPIMNLVEKETWEDGRVSYVSTSKMALKNNEGETIGTFGISRDVSETKLLELNMEKREKLLTSLIAFTDENLILVDRDFQYQFICTAFAEKFDLDPLDVEGKKINWFVHSDDEEGLRGTMERLKHKEEKKVSFRHIGELGKYEQVEALIQNCLDEPSLQGYVFRIKKIG